MPESKHTDGMHDSPTETDEITLELDEVSKYYGNETAVENLNLSVHKGELLTLLGPSGCGKTTTLRMLAGLEQPDTGTIEVDDRIVADQSGQFVKPERRDVGIVFQDYALFPHLTVAENIAFGLQDKSGEETTNRVNELLDLVNLEAQKESMPDELSGGQQQRVALARSLAPEPEVLLLDEPFSNLDVRLRIAMREEVRRILKEAGVTAVSVTHDQEEALSISDRVAVMYQGKIEQIGRPEEVFEHPKSRFVASFLGQAGFVTGRLEGDRIETGIDTFNTEMIEGLSPEYEGAKIDILLRPDDLRAIPAEDNRGDGEIVHRQYTGPSFVYRVALDSGDIVHCQHNHASEFEIGQRVTVDLVADHTLAWYPAA
ncbi:MAG: ABC transporter ATP-binding protein [Halobacteriaceae archaeon]